MAKYKGHVRPSQQLYFKEGGTWTAVSSGDFGVRYYPKGYLFDAGGQVVVGDNILSCIAYLNSSIFSFIASVCMPTINYKCGVISNLPNLIIKKEVIIKYVNDNIHLARNDWDLFETSFDFKKHFLMRDGNDLKHIYEVWKSECMEYFNAMRTNEEAINRIYVDYYQLNQEIDTTVKEESISLVKPDKQRDMRSLISYAVGCMFGRYSLDVEGLAYAGGDWDASKYTTFIPDADNIIPICDDDYFDDDITGRFVQWVEVVYGKGTLEENLTFIADALGGKGTSREIIRNYFLKEFYADHCKTYKKRPIYWLFDSGKKNGFKALIYMHRYQPDLLARMRTDYVHEQQERYRTQLAHIDEAIQQASGSERVKLTKQQKKLQDQSLEIQKYEEKIHHLADQNITIDLDDGVKHNYALFADVLAKIK